MKVFYIDTSSSFLYTAIYENDKIINKKCLNLSKDLSTFTVNEVDKMFQEKKIKPRDIDKIIVVNGPGSFTGIRIGLTLAKIYAFCLNKEITTITSLEAMAKSIKSDKLIIPIIDARRNACYAAIYNNNETILKPSYITIEKLMLIINGLNKDYLFISNDKFDFDTIEYHPDFKEIIESFINKESINPHLVNPDYLKLTEAEENKMKEVKE